MGALGTGEQKPCLFIVLHACVLYGVCVYHFRPMGWEDGSVFMRLRLFSLCFWTPAHGLGRKLPHACAVLAHGPGIYMFSVKLCMFP
jgi:hypothetical protein